MMDDLCDRMTAVESQSKLDAVPQIILCHELFKPAGIGRFVWRSGNNKLERRFDIPHRLDQKVLPLAWPHAAARKAIVAAFTAGKQLAVDCRFSEYVTFNSI